MYVPGSMDEVLPLGLVRALESESTPAAKACTGVELDPTRFGHLLAWLLFLDKYGGPATPLRLRTAVTTFLRETGLLSAALSQWLPHLAPSHTSVAGMGKAGTQTELLGDLSEALRQCVEAA